MLNFNEEQMTKLLKAIRAIMTDILLAMPVENKLFQMCFCALRNHFRKRIQKLFKPLMNCSVGRDFPIFEYDDKLIHILRYAHHPILESKDSRYYWGKLKIDPVKLF